MGAAVSATHAGGDFCPAAGGKTTSLRKKFIKSIRRGGSETVRCGNSSSNNNGHLASSKKQRSLDHHQCGNGSNVGSRSVSRASHCRDEDLLDKFSTRSRRRSSAAAASAVTMTVAAKPPELKPGQRRLVKETWAMVEEHISEIGLTAFLSLFQRSPEALSLFPFLKHLDKEDLEFYSQLQNHAVRVTGVVTLLVKELDDDDDGEDGVDREGERRIRDFLVDLGRRHFSYGSRPNQMELLGHAFVDTFMHIFAGDARRAEIQEAWKAFFSIMCFWMAHGYMFVQNKGHPTAVGMD